MSAKIGHQLTAEEAAKPWVRDYGRDAPQQIRRASRGRSPREKAFFREMEFAAEAILAREQKRTEIRD